MGKKGQFTAENAAEMGKKGGIQRGINIRERKTMRRALEDRLAQDDTLYRLADALINRALTGDVPAYTTIRDTVGEKPVDKQQIAVDLPTINIVRAPEPKTRGKKKAK